MSIKIKLLKSWEYGEEVYEPGEVLEVDSTTAKELFDGGIATKEREVKPVEVEFVEKADGSDLEAKIKEAVKSEMGEVKRQKISGGDLACKDAPNGGFEYKHQFYGAVAKAAIPGAKMDERLLVRKTAGEMETGDGALGGFLVPDAFMEELLKGTPAGGLGTQGEVLSRVRTLPLAVNTIVVPYLDESSRVDGSRSGGVNSAPTTEGGQASKSAPALGQCQLTLNKVTSLMYVSDELIEDSPMSIPAVIEPAFTDELTFKRENHIIRGTGAGQAQGILNANALITVPKETNQDADTIVPQNLTNMYSRMTASSIPNAVWFVNQDVFPQIHLMALATGTAGVPVMLPGMSMSTAPYGTILGRPIVPVEYCSTLGDVGDIIFADMSQYLLATKGGITGQTSVHLRFDYFQTAFRWSVRQDGQSWRRTALTPANGSNTTSPFVTLAARA